MLRRRTPQQELPFAPAAKKARRRRTKKAAASGAPRQCLPHVARPAHDKNHPMHVTMERAAPRASFRRERLVAAIKAQIAYAVRRGVGVVHYTIQHDHLHLIVEAEDKTRASRALQFLFSRIAAEVNRVERRHGKLFADRHHRRPLTTPSEVRNALVYVLFNDRKHAQARAEPMREDGWIDPCSSAMWFQDWDPRARPPPQSAGPSPLAQPQTWLARDGWKKAKAGLLRFDELPRSA